MRVLVLVLFLMLSVDVRVSAAQESGDHSKLDRARTIMEEAKTQDKKSSSAPDLSGASMKMVQGLGLCLAILMGGVYLAKKFKLGGTPSSGRSMKLIERVALSPRSSLVLAEVQGKKILVAVGSDRVTMHPLQEHDFDFAAVEEASKGSNVG